MKLLMRMFFIAICCFVYSCNTAFAENHHCVRLISKESEASGAKIYQCCIGGVSYLIRGGGGYQIDYENNGMPKLCRN